MLRRGVLVAFRGNVFENERGTFFAHRHPRPLSSNLFAKFKRPHVKLQRSYNLNGSVYSAKSWKQALFNEDEISTPVSRSVSYRRNSSAIKAVYHRDSNEEQTFSNMQCKDL